MPAESLPSETLNVQTWPETWRVLQDGLVAGAINRSGFLAWTFKYFPVPNPAGESLTELGYDPPFPLPLSVPTGASWDVARQAVADAFFATAPDCSLEFTACKWRVEIFEGRTAGHLWQGRYPWNGGRLNPVPEWEFRFAANMYPRDDGPQYTLPEVAIQDGCSTRQARQAVAAGIRVGYERARQAAADFLQTEGMEWATNAPGRPPRTSFNGAMPSSQEGTATCA